MPTFQQFIKTCRKKIREKAPLDLNKNEEEELVKKLNFYLGCKAISIKSETRADWDSYRLVLDSVNFKPGAFQGLVKDKVSMHTDLE